MSRHSAKSAGRTPKAAARTPTKSVKKAAKTARGSVKKASKSARGRTTKPAREVPAKLTHAPSMAPEPMRIIRTPSPPVQPVVMPELPVRTHKYHVGETVYFTSPSFGRAAANGSYTVVKLLPSEGDDYQYRIKSSGEAFERVAKESQLDRA